MQQKGKKNILHYVAVNARTSETMGSVPIHFPKLWGFTILIALAAIIAAGILRLTLDEDNVVWWVPLLGLSACPIFFLINYFGGRE